MKHEHELKSSRPWFSSWPQGLTKNLDYPRVPMFEALENSARRYPDKTAVIYYGREMTYRQVWEESLALAGYLRHAGVGRGDRVTICLPNTPHFVVAYYGVLRANAIAVTIDPMLNAEKLQVLLNDNDSKVVVTLTDLLPLFDEILADTAVETVVACDYADYLPAESEEPGIPVPDFMRRQAEASPESRKWGEIIARKMDPPAVEVGPEDPALIVYTSGTTGVPKGALHTHKSLVANCLRATYMIYETPAAVNLGVLPFFHVTGMHCCMTNSIYVGGTLVILTRWDREAAVAAAEKYRCTHWINITTMVVDMLRTPGIEKRDLSSFVIFGGGGAPMPAALAEQLEQNLGIRYLEGYGLTEGGAATHLNPVQKPKLQCLGIPSFDVDTKLIDPLTGKEAAPGEEGELVMRTPSVFREYWNKPEETREAFLEIDGQQWLRTGDLARMDEEGYFFIVDRIKRMINRAGLKVWPAAVENTLYKHPAVKEACVVRVPDERVGEEVKALIVLHDQFVDKITAEEIKAWSKEKLAAYEYPRVVEFVDELPKSSTGKILWKMLQ